MTATITTYTKQLKEFYSDDYVDTTTATNHPTFALFLQQKKANAGGIYYKEPISYADPQGVVGAGDTAFAVAVDQAGLTSTVNEAWLVPTLEHIGVHKISNHLLKASMGSRNAFMDARTKECDGLLRAHGRAMARHLFGAGWGKIGVVATGGITSATIQLATPGDAFKFEKGMQLSFAADENAATLRAFGTSGRGCRVKSVNAVAGTILCEANVTDATDGVPLAVAGDTIFVNGTRATGASPSKIVATGLGDWLPTAVPSSTAHFGVDRTLDPMLYGQIVDGSGNRTYEACIQELDRLVFQRGGKLSHIIMNPQHFQEFCQEMGTRVQLRDDSVANVSFSSLTFSSQNGGTLKIVNDPDCNADKFYGIQLNTWRMPYLGDKPIHIQDDDGSILLRGATSNSYEFRTNSICNFVCAVPGFNGVVSKTAAP